MTRRQRIVMLIAALVAAIGLADSGYLTVKHLRGDWPCLVDRRDVVSAHGQHTRAAPLPR